MSCVGSGTGSLWAGMNGASTRPQQLSALARCMRYPLLYTVTDPSLGDPTEDRGDIGRGSRLATLAALEAVADARLGDAARQSRRCVVVGTGMGDSSRLEAARADGLPAPVSPFTVAQAVGDAVGATGPVSSVSNACATSAYAISVGADLIRAGQADVVVAGGAEGHARVALGCFNRLGAIDPERCRPFASARRGTVFGEGAAILVLESLAHAAARGAREQARVAGAGWSCDAYHATAPEPTGAQIVRAMWAALAEAGLDADDIGVVLPHGTGTELNDAVESRALGDVLGQRVGNVPLYSAKALLGHTGGAAGALAVAMAVLILRHAKVPGNIPLHAQDPECQVWLPEQPTAVERPAALVNAYAFGGNNASLIIRRVDT